MSEPITISVRDLSAEHIGWRLSNVAQLAEVGEIDYRGRRALLWRYPAGDKEWAVERVGRELTMTPPPRPDPWEGVPMPGGYIVQRRGRSGHWFWSLPSAQKFAAHERERGLSVRIVHLSASGAEVVE